MVPAPLAAFMLVVSVATGPIAAPSGAAVQMTAQQKSAELQPLMRSATECIAHAVAADPRFARPESPGLGDLIVESMPVCAGTVRNMINAYDRLFGPGSGEAFFMGPYLDVLPETVSSWVAGAAP